MAGVRQGRTVRVPQGHQRARLLPAAFRPNPDPSRKALPNLSRKAGTDTFGQENPQRGTHGLLQALLFHVAFWRLNLGYFDRYAVDTWPQNEVGVVLWSLSASAHDWLARETLTRLCAIPVVGILEWEWDFGSSAMEFRILRPLWWFGLLEARSEEKSATEFVT